MKETCEDCGGDIEIGDWPLCHGDPDKHVPVRHFGEEPMEPYIDENLTSEVGGIEITTRAQRRKIMDANALEYRKKAPKPGGRLFFDMAKGR